MIADDPFNVSLLDIDNYVQTHRLGQVTSLSIHESSSTAFSVGGLFSETIFGQLGSTDRLITFGYIKLNTSILHPLIYKNLVKLASLYEDILTGVSYAIFDHDTNMFTRCLDPENHEEAGTGYTFFMGHFALLQFERNDSRVRSDRIDIIEKYRKILFCQNLLVLPAGLRDLEEDQGNLTTDDINKLYQTLLSYSFAIPPTANSSIYDGVRVAIQRKAVEIYSYIENILTGKRGFIQGSWGHRRIALGTRNVITAASYATMTPNDPQTIQPDETKLGLFQSMKALQPIVVHHVRKTFFDPILGQDANLIALVDPETLQLSYHEISDAELNKFDTSAAIEGWISRFRNSDIRYNPVTITAVDGIAYYFLMIYDEGDEISLFRGLADFQSVSGREIDRQKIRPITWAELLYMATYNAASGKHVFITRYPVIQDESCYPSKIHLCTTIPSRIVRLRNTIADSVVLTYPEYPILGKPFLDSVQIHTARLQGLSADFDGDEQNVRLDSNIKNEFPLIDGKSLTRNLPSLQRNL